MAGRSSAPSEKRSRNNEKGEFSIGSEDVAGDIEKALEEIDECQSQIDSLNEQSSEEILRVEMRFNEQRKPHYQKRSEITEKISGFWITTFMNHPTLSMLINDEQQKCLQHMKNLFIEEFEDIKNGYKIVMKFNPNPYFENETLSKEYHLGANGDPKCIVTPIKWKQGQNFLEGKDSKNDANGRKRKAADMTFFQWYVDTKHVAVDEYADLLKDEIWPNPLQYYLLPEVEEENGEEEEDDAEGVDEEEVMEEEEIDDDDES